MTEDFNKLEKQVNELLTWAVPGDLASILALLNDLLLVLHQHSVEEVVAEVFLILERSRNRIIVTVKPLIA